jgi:UDP-4-amino-4,6-dideoxy-N-acetyl-beta-L-altrosamine transaminase
MIPYGHQSISEEDIQAVVDVLRSDFLTQGPMVPQFEQAICGYTGSEYAIAVNSGTSALHVACRALDLGPGDVLWTTPITFVASANCALYCGAEVDFVDIDPKTYNICTKTLEKKLKQADAEGRLPKIIIPVHMCGLPCDMEALAALSQQYGFSIIEDASHAIGGRYQGDSVGSCRYSDITIFSFHPVKNITTGEGGIATTNKKELADKMSLLRSHCITRDADKMTQKPDGRLYYQQIGLGYNYRMTDIQAALGLSQMSRLDEFIEKRHSIAKRYDELLADLPVITPWQSETCYSGFHLYVIRIQLDKLSVGKQQIIESMWAQGIKVNVHYIPVYTQPYYQNMGFDSSDFPEANQYYAEAISLPMYPDLTEAQQDQVVGALKKAMGI